VETAVSHFDVAATLLELGGASAAPELRGRSLVGLANANAAGHPGYAIAECHSHGNSTGSFLVRKGDWKYIYFSWHAPLLFNLRDDPDELNDRSNDPGAQAIRRELDGILRSVVDPDAVALRAFAEQERRLSALVQANTPSTFRKILASRLGAGQAAVLASRFYSAVK
jgi:choline-sulfatase